MQEELEPIGLRKPDVTEFATVVRKLLVIDIISAGVGEGKGPYGLWAAAGAEKDSSSIALCQLGPSDPKRIMTIVIRSADLDVLLSR